MITRRAARLQGTVQGVGLRPFVARLGTQLGLVGRVRNSAGEVRLEVEGEGVRVDEFARRLVDEAPGRLTVTWTDAGPPASLDDFRIESSDGAANGCVPIPPDLAPCASCRAEIDAEEGRYAGYPFTSCVQCGPRVSILREPPYDRARTSMDAFELCASCSAEYHDPSNRRGHAQSLGCAACGPTLRLSDRRGAVLARGDDAMVAGIESLRRGEVVALRGVGGFQLLVDARAEVAVARLRRRKQRPAKPFAVMFADVDAVRRHAVVDATERASLESPVAPIVLLDEAGEPLAPSVAPVGRRVGAMLPASPLHHLLVRRFGGPLVTTSGNRHGEPLARTNAEARDWLGDVGDVFLTHDRDVVRRLDDSVVQVMRGRVQVLRRARGLAPETFELSRGGPPLLATGGHLKNAPAAAVDERVVLWPQVGDLASPRARHAFEESVNDLGRFLDLRPEALVTDEHPDYATTLWSERRGLPRIAVQHHHAHVAATLAEHGCEEALGVAWDGFGLGVNGEWWGGEFLHVTPRGATRVAHLRPFPLPGGAAAAEDSWRCLAGASVAAGVAPPDPDPALARFMALARSPTLASATSSVGRLFDAVAGLLGRPRHSQFEGHLAAAVEELAQPGAAPYAFERHGAVLDWRRAWAQMVDEREDAIRVASRFHATLVAMIVRVAEERRTDTVALAGGCFQNRRLTVETWEALESRGFRVLVPLNAPSGDGGLALGQAWVARHRAAPVGGT